jgi:hypothetical protein
MYILLISDIKKLQSIGSAKSQAQSFSCFSTPDGFKSPLSVLGGAGFVFTSVALFMGFGSFLLPSVHALGLESFSFLLFVLGSDPTSESTPKK